MRRLMVLALACLCTVGSLILGASAAHADTPTCGSTVQITSLGFSPATVTAGQGSAATLSVQNCSSQPVQLGIQFYAQWLTAGGSTGLPPGCVVYDPLVRQVSIPAGATAGVTVGYSTFASCAATGLRLSLGFSPAGQVSGPTSTDLVIQGGAAPPACTVTYRNSSEWSTGFVAQASITNTGTAPVNGWTLTFAYPGDQQLTSAWGAQVSQAGSAVSAAALSWNTTIAAGATVTVGFVGQWHTSDAPPGTFQLNHVTCRTA